MSGKPHEQGLHDCRTGRQLEKTVDQPQGRPGIGAIGACKPQAQHRATHDIQESINELKKYLSYVKFD